MSSILYYLANAWTGSRNIFATPTKDEPKIVCSLPDCNKTTSHNGGYCCAEHCIEHREQIKARKLKLCA